MNRQQRFVKSLLAGLKELGLKVNNGKHQSYPHYMETKYGRLLVHVHEDEDSRRAQTYTCCSRFEEPHLAKGNVTGVNPYTGKFNFHYYVKGNTPEDIATIILGNFDKVVDKLIPVC